MYMQYMCTDVLLVLEQSEQSAAEKSRLYFYIAMYGVTYSKLGTRTSSQANR